MIKYMLFPFAITLRCTSSHHRWKMLINLIPSSPIPSPWNEIFKCLIHLLWLNTLLKMLHISWLNVFTLTFSIFNCSIYLFSINRVIQYVHPIWPKSQLPISKYFKFAVLSSMNSSFNNMIVSYSICNHKSRFQWWLMFKYEFRSDVTIEDG